MKVVRHDDKSIQQYLVTHRLGPLPLRSHNFPASVEDHLPVPDRPEETSAIMGAPPEHFLASLRAQIVTKYAANVRESKAGCRGFVRLRIGGPYLWGDVSLERHIAAVGHNVEIQDGPTPIG